ncbi:AAA family ATPase [Mycobacterium sp. Aquia_213]|uniref:AAA family ATPase n=1 Tax=Mycobacterium sp. Aquia_213 TaxID=2991728 RepID=UPI00226DD257|nr:AAA family ATPase [Mycobacterium sp. Aquia_213]WAC90169.1 AAA family ATPase [Mycobacterium sp. Aquia_213]
MANEQLKDQVLRCADDDDSLSEQARLALLAAFENPNELSEILGGEQAASSMPTPLSAEENQRPTPVGAFLTSIVVRGFRGIGPTTTVPLQPGPGLTVIAGRNGSGKSTLAEALELALTGVNSRWRDKTAVWSQTWRNLHAGEPAEIRIGIAEEGSGTTVIGVDWPKGAEDVVTEKKAWVQRSGQKREPIDVLGWNQALEMYRPILSYDELGQILEGSPSKFHDQLYKLLGLEQLTDAIGILDSEVKLQKQPGADLKISRDALKITLADHQDPRAATALTQITKSKPDLDSVRPLITEGARSTLPPAWQQAQQLSAPSSEAVTNASTALRSAAATEQQQTARSDALATDRSRLLSAALTYHRNHGDQPCPICGEGSLDAEWAASAQRTVELDQSANRALTTARAATEAARRALIEIIRAVIKPPVADDTMSTLKAAHDAFDRWSNFPIGDDAALAEHAEAALPQIDRAYNALRDEASALTSAREDAWGPIAIQLAELIGRAEKAAEAAPKLKIATDALKWLQANASQLRNERIAPLAEKARAIWAALRQESNVDLGAIRLEGQKTHRRVVLEAAVDGAETEAFGVMSQGELHALALAVFLPRATLEESPFRFVVLDDPIQAMDPSKIEGFLEVLNELAVDRQVIVLTHDDRLPAAIRRSRAQARILEVTRGANSLVAVTDSSRPATRLLDDAYAIAADDAVPDAIKKAAIPVLCREALESVAWDAFCAAGLIGGRSSAILEADWQGRTNTRMRVASAVDPSDPTAVDKWIGGGSARQAAMAVATKGIHGGVQDYKVAVQVTKTAVNDLSRLAR